MRRPVSVDGPQLPPSLTFRLNASETWLSQSAFCYNSIRFRVKPTISPRFTVVNQLQGILSCHGNDPCWHYFFAQLSGITLIVIGAVMKALYATYLDFLGHQFISVPMLFIVIGIIIFLVAFFGCCGAIRENHCMTTTVGLQLHCTAIALKA